jgi:hypothetical protein
MPSGGINLKMLKLRANTVTLRQVHPCLTGVFKVGFLKFQYFGDVRNLILKYNGMMDKFLSGAVEQKGIAPGCRHTQRLAR